MSKLRPSYSVTVEHNMVVEWDIRERVESPREGGKFASLVTARAAAKNRAAQGLRKGERVAIRDSRYEIDHGFHLGYTGRAYKEFYE